MSQPAIHAKSLTGSLPSGLDGQAAVRYLGHSAWLVHTGRRILLLDYGELPERDATAAANLDEGCLDLQTASPKWLDLPGGHQSLVIIASHRHRDHYHAGLHRWLVERLAPADSAVFVLGLDEQDPSPAWAADSPLTRLVRPNEAHPLGPDGWMATIQSTDQGVALLIDFPEISLYFGGDLALWADEPFYHKQHATSLARLASLLAEARPANGWLPRRPVDLAFVPVCTSDGYQEPALTEGALSTVRLLDPKHLFPMHGRTFEALYDRFASTLAHRSPDFAGTVHVAHQPGDLFAVELQNSRQESHHGQ